MNYDLCHRSSRRGPVAAFVPGHRLRLRGSAVVPLYVCVGIQIGMTQTAKFPSGV